MLTLRFLPGHLGQYGIVVGVASRYSYDVMVGRIDRLLRLFLSLLAQGNGEDGCAAQRCILAPKTIIG